MRSVPVLAVLLLNSTVAFGHPGHGIADPSSVRHYVTSPMHVGSMVGSLALLVIVGRLLLKARSRTAAENFCENQPQR
jgi:hypothetical protein